MKIIVAGCRDFTDYDFFKKKLDLFFKNLITVEVEIVSGGARGVDSMAIKYAKEKELRWIIFPADWDKHGKAGGFIRNQLMAEYSEGLLAFWDFKSKGTMDMIDRAKKHKLKIKIINIHDHMDFK